MKNDRRKSDRPVVAAKPSNKAEELAAERVERRGLAKGKPTRQNTNRALHWVFQHWSEAEQFHKELAERFANYSKFDAGRSGLI